jgi:hypothetical protein
METKLETQNAFEGVIVLIEDGVKSWQIAGQMITIMRQKDPQCYAKIIALRPWLTASMLETMERIGDRRVYPYVLLEPARAGRWLLGYSYETQVDACTNGVDVLMYYKNGKPFKQKKMLKHLSRHESYQVFGPTKLRKVEDQLPYLKSTVTHGGNKGTTPQRGISVRGTDENKATPHPEGPSHRETIGVFRITIGDKSAIVERVNNAPPNAQIVEVQLKSGKHVAYVKLVEVVATQITDREQAWRDLKAEMKIETPAE